MITDAFVGMPPVEQLQSFLLRLLTGQDPPPIDLAKADQYTKSPEQLKALGNKLAHLAGRRRRSGGWRWLREVEVMGRSSGSRSSSSSSSIFI